MATRFARTMLLLVRSYAESDAQDLGPKQAPWRADTYTVLFSWVFDAAYDAVLLPVALICSGFCCSRKPLL